jgi:hypothetical protein
MTCNQTSTLGVYLLGALEPEERSSFESHLYGCDQCRAELVRLAPLPGLLNQIAITDFEETAELPPVTAEPAQPTAPEQQPEQVTAPVLELPKPVVIESSEEPDTRRAADLSPARRRWLIAAAAAVVLVLTIGGILTYEGMNTRSTPPQAHTVTWSAVDPISGVHADVQLTEEEWGTGLKVWMSNLPPGKACRLVVKAKYGYRDKPDPYVEVAGWWSSDHAPDDDIPGSTSIDLASIYRLEIMDGDTMLVGIRPT